MKTNLTKIFIALALLSIFIVGCQQITPTLDMPGKGVIVHPSLDADGDIETKQFKSEKELLKFIKEYEIPSWPVVWTNTGAKGMGALLEGTSNGMKTVSIKARDFSETNIQVKGVDEADIIKTDGNYIYTVSGKVLFIVKAYPGKEAEIVSKIKLNATPSSIFIKGDKLAVFGNYYDKTYFNNLDFAPSKGMTFFNIYDIKDRKSPKLTKEYKFEGKYFRARMADGKIYILTNSALEQREVYPTPLIIDGVKKRAVPLKNVYYYNVPYINPYFINIHSIDLKSDIRVDSKSIAVESGLNLYVSNDNIYLTYTEYVNENDIKMKVLRQLLESNLTLSDKKLILKIKTTENEILTKKEKETKIHEVYYTRLSKLSYEAQEDFAEKLFDKVEEELKKIKVFEYTIINKIKIKDGTITPMANGKVPGHTINQFSLDESNGVLRIATTLSSRWSSYDKSNIKSSNNVYTLDSKLKILDGLEGLAEDERIYSTRFIDGRLYMVTFKQVDPFFVIDLSNPKDIKELGKLKIPGFSRYLHPYDKDVIIGIGNEASTSGRVEGLKISLFDVSDVTKPKEIAKYVTESKYASSNALYEHKAFLFSKDKNLLVIPAYNRVYNDPSQNYNGAFVFEIKKDSVKLRGLVDHSSSNSNYGYPTVERSLYIEGLLYTKSPGLLRINKISDLSKVKNIELKYQNLDIIVY